jgi:hypothetical protein
MGWLSFFEEVVREMMLNEKLWGGELVMFYHVSDLLLNVSWGVGHGGGGGCSILLRAV